MIRKRHFDIPLAFVAVLPFGVAPWWILLVFLPFIIIILFFLLNNVFRSRDSELSKDSPTPLLKEGTFLHKRYHIKQVIRQEEMGAVYLADDTQLNYECTIKEIIDHISDPALRAEAVEYFQSDARMFTGFAHPNIIPILDFFTDGNKHYLVTPHVKGYTLLEYLSKWEDALPEDQVISWAQTICDVLIKLHTHQPPIIYQDLNPENIIFAIPEKLMLSVYGILRHFYADMSGEQVNSLGYAPPEQWQGLAEPRSDLYALGATMHHILTDMDPRKGNPFDFPPLLNINPKLSKDIEQIVSKLLQMKVEQRYPSAEALKADLQQLSPQDTSVQPSTAESTASTVSSIPKAIVNTIDDAEMILIPEGEFLMGSLEEEGGDDERPKHRVTLDAFYIDKYPVTNAQYKKFVDESPQWRKKRIDKKFHGGNYLYLWDRDDFPRGKATHPVVYVSWYAAQAYAEWAEKRLLTEAEWEKAARGTDGIRYPWGDNAPNTSCCNFNSNVDDTTPVDEYSEGESPYEVMDMAGNVWEWCTDFYDKDYYKSSPIHNPKGPVSGEHRVCRGGSWQFNQYLVRCAFRRNCKPINTDYDIGFRCAKDL